MYIHVKGSISELHAAYVGTMLIVCLNLRDQEQKSIKNSLKRSLKAEDIAFTVLNVTLDDSQI